MKRVIAIAVSLAALGVAVWIFATREKKIPLAFYGNVDIREVNLSFRVSGKIDQVLKHEGDRVAIAVADHGIGIPARDIERVFERFYRVDQARSRQTGGTGLGLAIVRHVAANHHGSVDVTSRLGEGSCFTLRLPSAETGAADPTAPTREALPR